MAKNVGIISAGAWGTAIGKILGEQGHQVTMWDYMPDVVQDINGHHQNSRYLLGIDLPPSVRATGDITEAADGMDYLIISTPSLYVINVIKRLITVPSIMEGKTQIAVLAKGFIPSESGPKFIVESIENYLPGFYQGKVVYISGPSHAEEVSRGKLTGLISACPYGKNAILFRELLNSPTLLVFSSLDIRGVQTAAAVKNVVAIAFGMLDALMELSENFGDNTESLLLAAGLNEIMSLGMAIGATHPQTFTSIAGVGDLDVTCRSHHGRNRRFGREIVQDKKLEPFSDIADLITNIDKIGYLPEGAAAAVHVMSFIEKYRLKLPICSTVFKVLNRELEPLNAVQEMLKSITGLSFIDAQGTV
ncbi:MAG: NAD(P)-dependent glycerol-3-phosphate dehydrogenase [Spirochaetales bacterium]|nr:NAD(P)-dependent glycerol-3-phosphate dehydrogenase [Spirochaetales bacterium]